MIASKSTFLFPQSLAFVFSSICKIDLWWLTLLSEVKLNCLFAMFQTNNSEIIQFLNKCFGVFCSILHSLICTVDQPNRPQQCQKFAAKVCGLYLMVVLLLTWVWFDMIYIFLTLLSICNVLPGEYVHKIKFWLRYEFLSKLNFKF